MGYTNTVSEHGAGRATSKRHRQSNNTNEGFSPVQHPERTADGRRLIAVAMMLQTIERGDLSNILQAINGCLSSVKEVKQARAVASGVVVKGWIKVTCWETCAWQRLRIPNPQNPLAS